MKRQFGSLCLAGLVALLAACAANPYSQFYKGNEDARKFPPYDPNQPSLSVSYSADIQRDIHSAIRHGFVPVGESAFHGNMAQGKESNVRAQAEKIGATLVIVSTRQTGTQTGAVPLVLPNNSTTYSNATATAYGPSGTATAYGTGTSTTYGTQTVMMPYSVNIGDFDAVYFVKARFRTGMYIKEMPDDIRQQRQSNFGVLVFEVVEGSPAYAADILPGDIVVAVNGEKVQSFQQYGALVEKYGNTTQIFTLERGGKTVDKPLPIASYHVQGTQK
jgi:hypothetical protein